MIRRYTWLMTTIFIAGLFATSGNAVADVVAIVNKANTAADKTMIGKLYTIEAKAWPNGTPAKLYDLPGGAEREVFYMVYTGKTAGNVRSIWAKEVFAGRAVLPKVLPSEAAVLKEVANDKNAVGYVNESSVDGSVRAVH